MSKQVCLEAAGLTENRGFLIAVPSKDAETFCEKNNNFVYKKSCVGLMVDIKSMIQIKAARTLLEISKLANQCVGDALTDLLLAECAMMAQNFSIEDWSKLYEDRPSRMTKVKVADRLAFKTTNAERTCVSPEGVQVMKLLSSFRFKTRTSF